MNRRVNLGRNLVAELAASRKAEFKGPYSTDYGACWAGHPTNAWGRCKPLNKDGTCEPPSPEFTSVFAYVCLNCLTPIIDSPVTIADHFDRAHTVLQVRVVKKDGT